MCTNKFLIGGLIRVDVSSIVNKVIRTISSLFIFFLRKYFERKKRKSSQNQPTKQKQVNKNNKDNNFSCRNTSKRVKIICLAFLTNIEIVLIASFTILLNYAGSTLPLSNSFYPSSHKTPRHTFQTRA